MKRPLTPFKTKGPDESPTQTRDQHSDLRRRLFSGDATSRAPLDFEVEEITEYFREHGHLFG